MTGLEPEALDMALEASRDSARMEVPTQTLLEFDANDEVPVDVVRAMCSDKLGIQLLFIPTEYGEVGGGTLDVYRACEAMAHIDLDTRDAEVRLGPSFDHPGHEEWAPFSVVSADQRRRFAGWWRRHLGQVLTIAAAAPWEREPIALVPRCAGPR